MEMNLTWTLCAGASPAPASWAAFEQMLEAKAQPVSLSEVQAASRGQYGQVKTLLLEVIAQNPGLRTRDLRRLMPRFSSNRVCCAASQLFIDGKLRRTGSYGRYAYFLKED